jgi:hypothetical protein
MVYCCMSYTSYYFLELNTILSPKLLSGKRWAFMMDFSIREISLCYQLRFSGLLTLILNFPVTICFKAFGTLLNKRCIQTSALFLAIR